MFFFTTEFAFDGLNELKCCLGFDNHLNLSHAFKRKIVTSSKNWNWYWNKTNFNETMNTLGVIAICHHDLISEMDFRRNENCNNKKQHQHSCLLIMIVFFLNRHFRHIFCANEGQYSLKEFTTSKFWIAGLVVAIKILLIWTLKCN